jgi:hypothetical protein
MSATERLESDLTGLLEGALDGVLSYEVGDGFRGATELRLHADGAYQLRSTRTAGRRRLTFDGRIDPERVRAVAATWREARVWEIHHQRSKPGEDDPEAVLALQAGARRSEVVLWVSEVPSSEAFQRAREPLLKLIQELSDGQILEFAR